MECFDGYLVQEYLDLKKQVMGATIVGLVYHIWWNRNDSLWNDKVQMVEACVQTVQYSIKNRMLNSYWKKNTQEDRSWFEAL